MHQNSTSTLKNDLIDNAPSIDLQDQFYDKVYTDEIFSKKSANLADLDNKATSRTNLEVYSKAETDTYLLHKASIENFDSFVNTYNTQKYLESKGAYKGYINTEKSFSGSFTYMFTYIRGSIGTKVSTTLEIFTAMYSEAGDRLSINTSLNKVSVYSEMNYDIYEYIDHYDYDFASDLYSGDKISIVYDSKTFNLKIYVNKVLASDINIGRAWSSFMYNLPCGEYFIDAAMFKSALVLADDSAYSIEKFVRWTSIPSFCYSEYEDTPEYNFPSGFTGISGSLYESGVSFAGEDHCLKIYPTTDTRFQTASILDIFNGKFVKGVFKKIKMKVYYPTTNVKTKVVKLVSGRDFAVYPKDEWQTVEFYKNSGYASNAFQFVSLRNDNATNFAGSGTGNDDVFYIASVSAEFDRHAILDMSNLKHFFLNNGFKCVIVSYPLVFGIGQTSLLTAYRVLYFNSLGSFVKDAIADIFFVRKNLLNRRRCPFAFQIRKNPFFIQNFRYLLFVLMFFREHTVNPFYVFYFFVWTSYKGNSVGSNRLPFLVLQNPFKIPSFVY